MSYTAADITELNYVQRTRLRPAVNLGLDMLNTALRKLVDNAIEEVTDPDHGGSTVTITLHADAPAAETWGAYASLSNRQTREAFLRTLGSVVDYRARRSARLTGWTSRQSFPRC